ncbi:MAG: hypothetical protein ABW148_04910 [Sedimenticola sp.]
MKRVNDSGLLIKSNGEVDIDFYIAEARRLRTEKIFQLLAGLGRQLKKHLSFEWHVPFNTRHSH